MVISIQNIAVCYAVHNTVLLFAGSWHFPPVAQLSSCFDEVTVGGLITTLF